MRGLPRRRTCLRLSRIFTWVQRQLALAADTGLRFVVDLEWSKPTCEIGKTLDVLNALGVDVVLDLPVDAA